MSEIRPNLVADIGLKIFQYFPNIESLVVTQDTISASELSQVLRNCTKIKYLDLSTVDTVKYPCSLTFTVTAITGLTSLERLAITTEEAFRVPCTQLFQRSTTLTELSITHTNPHKALLNYWLENVPYWTIPLKSLHIKGPTSAAFSYISSLVNLQYLGLDNIGLPENTINSVAERLTTLRHLLIKNIRINVSPNFLKSCSLLQSLQFQTSFLISLQFLNNLTSLTSLVLEMRMMSLVDLAPLTSLIHLSLRDHQDTCLMDYTPLKDLTPNLKHLALLTHYYRIDELELPRLESLETFSYHCPALGNILLKDYFPNLKKINEIRDIAQMNDITPENSVEELNDSFTDSGW